jgi:hypothetical protein
MNRKFELETASKSIDKAPDGAGGSTLMMTKDRIEREVESTLSCLEDKALLHGRPDFHARLLARIRDEKSGPRPGFASLFRLRVLVPAALAVMLAFNIVTAVLVLGKLDQSASVRQKAMAALAEEYDMNTSSTSSGWN